jgi:hypothetical protein
MYGYFEKPVYLVVLNETKRIDTEALCPRVLGLCDGGFEKFDVDLEESVNCHASAKQGAWRLQKRGAAESHGRVCRTAIVQSCRPLSVCFHTAP